MPASKSKLVRVLSVAALPCDDCGLLRLLVESIVDYAIFMLDVDGRVTTWNAGAEAIKGYTAAEIIGQHFSNFYTPEDIQAGKPQQTLSSAMKLGRTEDEGWRVRKDGSRFWADVVVTALRDENRELRGFAKVTRDLTERRRAEEERIRLAKEAAARDSTVTSLRALIDNLPELAWMALPDGHIDFYNQRWFDYTGTTFEEVEGWGWERVHDPNMLPEVVARWRASLASGTPFEMEYPLRGADGVFRWFLTRVLPVRSADGSIVRWIGTNANIDALKRSQESREKTRSEERHRLLTLLRQAPAIINYLRGPDLVFEFVHPKTTERLGGCEVLGKPLLEAIPEPQNQLFVEHVRRVYETGEPFEQLARFESNAQAVETYWDSVYLPVRDEQNRVEGVMTFDIDVTQSVVSRRQLEAANRAKDEFLATVSHELRTPLSAIVGWAAMLRQRKLDPPVAKPVEVIHRNAQAQVRIIEDILDVSRVITGKFRLEPKPTDLVAVVREAIEVVRPSAVGKRIAIDVRSESNVCLLVADPERLQQVVWNLLSNAVKFTEPGGTIDVGVSQDGPNISVRVVDSGKGIDPEFLPFVFDRFRQADATITRRVGGLGLGLALVRHIVELHGGHVAVTSEGLGKGSTFTVTLPVRAVMPSAHPEPPSRRVTSVERKRRASLNGVRVLVVDDEADARDLVEAVLVEAGAVVQTARSAAEGLDALKRSRPDVLVSDIGMPGEDGYVFLRRVRSLTTTDASVLPAIALTAYARDEDRVRALSAGYTTHLAKPVNPEVLTAAVANLAAFARRR